MKTLYIAWQEPETRRWYPVGELTRAGTLFRFSYTGGALQAQESEGFIPFGRMTDLHSCYESEELFPLFANRLLPSSRPEFAQFLQWLDMDEEDPFVILGRTGGLRGTDNLIVFPRPEETVDGYYEASFFSHGIRYLADDARLRIDGLRQNDGLRISPDDENVGDREAVGLWTSDSSHLVGYCPRFLAADLRVLLEETRDEGDVNVRVARVNVDAPTQLRLLCRVRAPWPATFQPCTGSAFVSLAVEPIREVA